MRQRLQELPVALGPRAVAEHVRCSGGPLQGVDVRGLLAKDGDEMLERGRFGARFQQERGQVEAQWNRTRVLLKRFAQRLQESWVSRQTT